ncbi:MAG: glycoside hydrolase family 2 TIM barrel-domain containing protein [Bacteroidota bacterium]|nr:glycoside hydrolase family 2 TIM barrel-domain containing protein [Bacteroidota bacterium]
MVHEIEKPYRNELCLNGKWQFMPVHETDLKKFQKPEWFEWDPVMIKIPSPWNVNTLEKGDGADRCTFPSYPKDWETAKMGWIQKNFVLPDGWKDKILILNFEAIAGYAKVYVNDHLVSDGINLFLPTRIDISPYVKDGINEITVGIAHQKMVYQDGRYGFRTYVAGSFFGQSMTGIWQDVTLLALPKVYVENVFVNPDVRDNVLDLSVVVKNRTTVEQTISLEASIREWEKPFSEDVNLAPADNGELKKEVFRIGNLGKLVVKSGDSLTVHLTEKVNGRLTYWTPDFPNLYGAVVRLKTGKSLSDINYTRFGWRQFSIDGTKLLLNGSQIKLKGDSWHFMGIPQMSRRYAWGWFKMLKDIHANAVRLHAQPYPSFYLDVADEMGICVLDESGIWGSDGCSRIDGDSFWEDAGKHVRNLVLRDRNHPSVFGWSVCNETLPVTISMMHAPESVIQRNIEEINHLVKVVKAIDPTRDWISGDGETQRETQLPTLIGHYGDDQTMKMWSSVGKPWGIGETGSIYYGTPLTASSINGNRAFESQTGRMEAMATEAYGLIRLQQKYNASYTSVFNVVWYGLKPMPFGMNNTSHAPELTDGIFFQDFQEGVPGVQPERLDPYGTTLNPGYDPNLPLYEPWPLFYAVQAANMTPVKDFKMEKNYDQRMAAPDKAEIERVAFAGPDDSPLKNLLESLGVPFVDHSKSQVKLYIVDGTSLVSFNPTTAVNIEECLKTGGRVLVCGVAPETLNRLNQLMPKPLSLTNRNATSFVIMQPDPMIGNLGNKDFYFSELSGDPVMKYGLSGDFVKYGKVIAEACNTDWERWNNNSEAVKTASVYISELITKPDGGAIIKSEQGNSEIYVTSIDLTKLKVEGEGLIKTLISNLGVILNGGNANRLQALSVSGNLNRAIVIDGCAVPGEKIIKTSNQDFSASYETAKGSVALKADENGFMNFVKVIPTLPKSEKVVYLSFWLKSPTSLVKLLDEFNLPRLDMKIENGSHVKVYVNGTTVVCSKQEGNDGKFEFLPLVKGWNHLLVCFNIGKMSRSMQTKIQFESPTKGYLNQLTSSVGQ